MKAESHLGDLNRPPQPSAPFLAGNQFRTMHATDIVATAANAHGGRVALRDIDRRIHRAVDGHVDRLRHQGFLGDDGSPTELVVDVGLDRTAGGEHAMTRGDVARACRMASLPIAY